METTISDFLILLPFKLILIVGFIFGIK